MTSLLAVSALTWAGRSLREGFFMFWETLWPLVLGFGLSGAVQALVPREQMERVMGNHRPPAVARASGLGMVPSSCSYAATAMAKSLFQKGADFVTAMVFSAWPTAARPVTMIIRRWLESANNAKPTSRPSRGRRNSRRRRRGRTLPATPWPI